MKYKYKYMKYKNEYMWNTSTNIWNTNMSICEIQEQIHKSVTRIRGHQLGSHTEFCIQRINMATHSEFAQNYLILFTFCNNIIDLNWVLQEIYPFLLAISIFAGNNITVCFKDDQIYFNWDHPAFQAKIYFVLYFCMVPVLRFHF